MSATPPPPTLPPAPLKLLVWSIAEKGLASRCSGEIGRTHSGMLSEK